MITDGDSKAHHAADQLYQEQIATIKPKHQFCTTHLRKNHAKTIKNSKFSPVVFPGRNASDRKTMQTRLSYDLSIRCHLEHVAAYTDFKGNPDLVAEKMKTIVKILPKCYQGDHIACKSGVYCCAGYTNKHWFIDNTYIKENDFKLDLCNPTDEAEFNKCVLYRLGERNLDRVMHLRNTQKCEACNRAINSSAPKNITFSRNYKARVASAIKRVNRGIGQAIHSQVLCVGGQISGGTRVSKMLLMLQKKAVERKLYDRSQRKREKRVRKRKTMYRLYEEVKAEKCYKSGIALDPKKITSHLKDHPYAQLELI